MLDGQRRQVLLGRLSYALFVLSSVLLLSYAGCTMAFWKNSFSRWNLMTYIAIILAIGGTSWLLATKVDRKMSRAYDSFWSPVTKIVKSNMRPAQNNGKLSDCDRN